MKKILLVVTVGLTISANPLTVRATPYFQTASFTPSNIQGELYVGAMKTNAGIENVSLLPIFYRNASASDPWYEPSFAPLAIGGSAGGGNASLDIGPIVDFGPQVEQGLITVVNLVSSSAGGKVASFFNCQAGATCAAISAFAVANLEFFQQDAPAASWRDMTKSPFGYGVGAAFKFGGTAAQ